MNRDEETSRLGAYLRARRDLVTPEQAGIPAGHSRRVAGLRREEVATLAGISAGDRTARSRRALLFVACYCRQSRSASMSRSARGPTEELIPSLFMT